MSKKGRHSIEFESDVFIAGHFGAVAGKREYASEYAQFFDLKTEDDTLGEKTYEQSERMLYKISALGAINNAGLKREDVQLLVGGDLLNQIISSGFTAREIGVPFFGLYGACSAMAESMIIGSLVVGGGFMDNVVCASSSHFATAERQFRQPLEMGTPKTPTSQITVSGSGAVLLSNKDRNKDRIKIKGGTIGCVIDLGIKDANNMGAAMAPACCNTMLNHFDDFKREPSYYDLIITGDLGEHGTKILFDMLNKKGIDIQSRHFDCGKKIFEGQKDIMSGASGCGCCASMLGGYILKSMIAGSYKKILFVATGAMLSKTSSLQGESIPCIAHAVDIEREV